MKNITVIGGGNFGMLLSAKFAQKNNVTLFTSNPKLFSKKIKVFREDDNSYYYGEINKITDSLLDSISNAEWIFITYPAFLFSSLAKDLVPLLHKGQHLVSVPGSGGFELFFNDALNKGCTLTGLQRVHSVARIIKKGEEVRESGIRKSINIASIPNSFNKEAADVLSELFDLQVNVLNNYLDITFINSNPILHTSRLFTIFKDYEKVRFYNKLPLFYEEWDIASSDLLIKMDEELFCMINKLKKYNIELNQIVPLLKHYESTNAIEMTKKLNSINSLKGLTTPSVKLENDKLIPDLSSRYFISDFPFGLDILLEFSYYLDISCKQMQIVSDWYHRITNTQKTFNLNNFNINNLQELLNYYNN